MVQNIVILGSQWGDEGKGKIVDFFAKEAQYVVRFQGGNNAGHTIIVDNKKIVLHLIPSGILYKHVINIISGGAVLSPTAFIKEIKELKTLGISICKRMFISESCSLVLPYHIAMDLAREKKNNILNDDESNKLIIGTTGCGIGPAYEDKVARRALRISDLYNRENFESKLKNVADYYNFQLVQYYHEKSINYKIVMNDILSISDCLIGMVTDVPKLLENARHKGDKVIFEGAQGALLDVDHGTYPYVTSAHTVAGGVTVGTGIGPNYIDHIVGVIKAYSTRVGYGPFPTELLDKTGRYLCDRGKEFGSTTGRRRRTGWFDAVAVRYSVKISSITTGCLTKLDVLDGLEYVKICVAYKLPNGNLIYDFPYSLEKLKNVIPVYEVYPGWPSFTTTGVKNIYQLPLEAKNYIKYLEEILGISISIISTGSDRCMNIVLKNPFNL